MHIRPDRDALIIVDQQLDFEPGGALAVAAGDVIVESIDRLAARFVEVVITQDCHPRGHVSFASSYRDRAPFSTVTLDEVERGVVLLSEQAAFTLDELAAYLAQTRGGIQALWPDHCVRGTKGAEIDARIDAARATHIIRKGYRPAADSYSAFRENDGVTTGLAECLMAKGIERILVVGLAGDYCVAATACDGADAGFDVGYVEDLTRFVGVPDGSRERAMADLAASGVQVIASDALTNV